MKYDVIIIGSGFGGLVCGHILSKQGKNVLLLASALRLLRTDETALAPA